MRLFPSHTDTADKIQIGISYALRASLVFAIIEASITQRWPVVFISALVLLLTFIPSFIERSIKVYIPFELELSATVFVYVTLFLGDLHNYYTRFSWWDLVAHAGSSLVIGLVGFIFLFVLYQRDKVRARPITLVLFSFCFALAIGALWEIVEFALDTTLGLNMQKSGLVDTMTDLIVNTIGALIASVMGYVYLKKRRRGIVNRIIRKILSSP
jgi:uncharacterized membrane protein